MQKHLLVLILTFCFFSLSAQADYQIKGTVTDPDQRALTGATVVALNPVDSALLSFAISDGDGHFTLPRLALPEVLLQVTYIGYGTFQQPVTCPAGDRLVEVGEVWLSPENLQLKEVIVQARHVPVVMKGDTVQYNAAAFSVKADDNVERLLKQLPGVEVDRDGSIKAQGEEVQQVLVDGKPFFGNNAQVATRNLPADAVEKVEVYDEASELEEFSGIADGQEEKTINLVLKEDKKSGQFGEVSAGYGNDGRYQGKANVNRFSAGSQLSLLGSANNINEPGFSVFDYIDFLGGFERLMSQGGGMVSLNEGDLGVPLDFANGSGINTTQALGLNYNRDFGENTTFSSNYFGSILSRELTENFTRNNFLAESTFRATGNKLEESRTNGHRLNTELQHEMGERQRLIAKANLGYTTGRTLRNQDFLNLADNGDPANESLQRYRHTPDRRRVGTDLQYFLKFATPGRVFTAGLQYEHANRRERENLFNRNRFLDQNSALWLTDSLDQRQLAAAPSDLIRTQIAYTEPLANNWYWQNTLTAAQDKTSIRKDFLDRTETEDYVLNTDLSGAYTRNWQTGTLNTGLLRTAEDSRFDFGLQVQRSRLLSGDRPARAYTHLLPRVGWQYDFTNSRSLNLNYRTQLNAPSLDQLRPLLENSNSLRLYTGNPDLMPEYQHSFTAGLSIIDAFSFTNFFLNWQSTYVQDRIVNSLTIDEQLRQVSRPVNSDYEWQNQLNASFSTPIPLDIMLKLRGSAGYNQGQLLLNATTDRAERWQQQWSLSFSNRRQDKFAWEIGAAWNYNQARYRTQTQFDQDYARNDWFAILDVFLPREWVLSTEAEHQRFSNEAFGQANRFTLWQASLRKSLLPNNRLTLRLSVFDLLNQNRGLERRNAFNYFEESRANALGRYAMLTATYKLSKVGE